MDVSENARLAYDELARTWRCRPQVFRHFDPDEQYGIFIASLEEEPSLRDATAVGTVGLSDHDLGMGMVRVELIGAFPRAFKDGPNVAATCAFNAFKDRMPTRPGAIHPRVVELYRPATSVPHILLADPFLWGDDGPHTLQLGQLRIAWLMMVPITEPERVFALTNGPDALSDKLAMASADILDLARTSVV